MKKMGWGYFILLLVFAANPGWAASFNCQKLVEETSDLIHCKNKFSNYPAQVHFFYPKKLVATKDVNINIHFHGHNIQGFDHLKDFNQMILAAKPNTILIVPESTGNCTTYDTFFKSQLNGLEFIKNLLEANELNYAGLSLSGHSGAYRVLRTIFSYASLEENLGLKIRGVGLFDAAYSNLNSIEKFAITHQDFIFFMAYVDGQKATTEKISRELKAKYFAQENFYFYPMKSTSEALLVQHFNVLRNPGLDKFLSLVF